MEGGLNQTVKGKLHLLENLSNKQTAIHKKKFSNQITPVRQRTGNTFVKTRRSQLPTQLSPLNTAEGVRPLVSLEESLDETFTTNNLSLGTAPITIATAPVNDRTRLH